MKEEPLEPCLFRPFMLELGDSAAGWNDGSHTTIVVDHIEEALVALHESIHDDIFSSTPDGSILRELQGLTRSPRKKIRSFLPSLKALTSELLKNSIRAHEVAATYLSLKLFPPEAGATLLDRVPAAYRGYYQTLSRRIDPAFPSTFLQYSLGRGIVRVVFYSCLLKRFVGTRLFSLFPLQQEELPDRRLQAVLKVLDESDMDKLRSHIHRSAEGFCRRHGRELWDLDSEEAWGENGAVAESLEMALVETFSRWILRKTRLPYLTEFQWKRTADLFGRFLDRYQKGLIILGSSRDESTLSLPGHLLAKALTQSNSRILNPKAASPARVDDQVLYRQLTPNSVQAFMILSGSVPGETEQLSALLWTQPSERPQIIGRFSSVAVLNWLIERIDLLRKGELVAETLGVVIAVRQENFYSIAQRILPIVQLGRDLYDVAESVEPALCWYWQGNWANFLFGQVQSKVVSLARFYPERPGRMAPEELPGVASFVAGVTCEVAKVPGIPGIFMRVLSTNAAYHVGKIEDILIDRRAIVPFEEEELEKIDRLTRRVMTMIKAMWGEF